MKRKKAADPGQQQKSGAAKPTYVPTDKPKKKMNEESDKKGKATQPKPIKTVQTRKTGRGK